jgi:hypothetical protein
MRIDVVIDAVWPDFTVEKAAPRRQCARSQRPGPFAHETATSCEGR